jgi:cytochrome P450
VSNVSSVADAAGRRGPTVDPPRFTAPDVIADPLPEWTRVRAAGPVAWCESMDAWLISGLNEADAFLRDPRTRSTAFRRREAQVRAVDDAGRYDDLIRIVGLQMAFMNQPDHSRVRRALQTAFTPKAVASWRPRIEGIVSGLLTTLTPGDDLLAGFAEPLPAIVIADLLGVPEADRDRFVRWSHTLVRFVGTRQAGTDYFDATQTELRDWAEFLHGIAAHQEGTVLAILLAQHDAGELSWDELVANAIFILAAGHETTTNLIGNGMLALARDPAAWAALREDASLLPTAVEELLRFDAPVQLMGRNASETIKLGDAVVPAGDDVIVMVGAANHDPTAFEEPARLDLGRTPNRHLAFAQGPHVCLGAALARLEGVIAFDALRQMPGELDVPSELSWRPNPAFRGLERFALSLG